MLCEKNDSQSYMEDFKKRFVNFLEKAPVLFSVSTSPSEVQVIDETTQQVYAFDWDYSIPVKSFIHGIKNVLVERCYPVIHKVTFEEIPVTDQEQIELASKGIPLDKIPTVVRKKKIKEFLIDKCVVYRDVFIIIDKETHQIFRYKMLKSSVFFLKDLRNNKFTKETAGDFFFKNSSLLNELSQSSEQ